MSAASCSTDAASRSLLSAYASWAWSMRKTLLGCICSRRFDAWVFAMSLAEATRAAAPPTAEPSLVLNALRNISASRRSAQALMTA